MRPDGADDRDRAFWREALMLWSGRSAMEGSNTIPKNLSDILPGRQESLEYATRMAFRSEAEMSIRRHNLRRLGLVFYGVGFWVVFCWGCFLGCFLWVGYCVVYRRGGYTDAGEVAGGRGATDGKSPRT